MLERFTEQKSAFSHVCNTLTPKHPVVLTTVEVQKSRCALLIHVSFQEPTSLETVMTTTLRFELNIPPKYRANVDFKCFPLQFNKKKNTDENLHGQDNTHWYVVRI